MNASRKLAYLFALHSALFLSLVAPSCSRTPAGRSQDATAEPKRQLAVDRVRNSEERNRMERYVATLQAGKKVVRSFSGPSGETIDCVDVRSQPALRRAGMEKHTIEFAPRTQPSGLPRQSQKQERERTPDQLYQLTGEACPELTVPMARLTMDTLKRFRTLDDFLRKRSGIQKPFGGGDGGDSNPPHEWAHASRSVNNWGAETVLNLWSPSVETSNEFSLSQMWVTRGAGSDLETVEAGWQVYDDLYGDWRAHLFIYFTPDNYGSGGCYNLSCSGFVQTNNTIYIGGGFTNYSAGGGDQWQIKLLWYKDGTNGHWWLKYGDTWAGYYPRSLFDANGLRDNADYIDFGGEIVNTSSDGHHTRTRMGSGYWPYYGYGWTAYQKNLRYVDTSNYYQEATGLNPTATNNMCYDVNQNNSGSWGVYLYFGGPGWGVACP